MKSLGNQVSRAAHAQTHGKNVLEITVIIRNHSENTVEIWKSGNHAEIWKSRTHETLVSDSSLKHLQLKLGSGSRFKTAVYTTVVMGDTVIHWVITTLTTLTIMMSSFRYWVLFLVLYSKSVRGRK